MKVPTNDIEFTRRGRCRRARCGFGWKWFVCALALIGTSADVMPAPMPLTLAITNVTMIEAGSQNRPRDGSRAGSMERPSGPGQRDPRRER